MSGVYYDVGGLIIVMQFMKNFNENHSLLIFQSHVLIVSYNLQSYSGTPEPKQVCAAKVDNILY
jgi:hypothetical protein